MFGEWLQEKMNERLVTAREVAMATDIDESEFSRLVHNKRRPSILSIAKLAKYFNVPAAEVAAAAEDEERRTPYVNPNRYTAVIEFLAEPTWNLKKVNDAIYRMFESDFKIVKLETRKNEPQS